MKKQSKMSKKDESLAAKRTAKGKPKVKYARKAERKIAKVIREGYAGKLHSGSKKGPIVTNPKQMIAIGISEAKRKGLRVPKKKGK